VKLSALKLLEFILETQGCSLDQAMVLILKAILRTYPGIQQSIQQNKGLSKSDSFCASVISSNASDYLRSPRHVQADSQKIEKGLFNTTVNLKNKNLPNDRASGGNDLGTITEYANIKEPNSGFSLALKNAYTHVLDTYISVLSSISSHILHQLFYEVIIQCVTGSHQSYLMPNPQPLNDIKVFSVKIAEKIITICQGDLVLHKHSLDQLIQ